MVHHSKDLEHLFRENIRGGHGPIETDIVYKKEELLGKATLFNRLTIKPGSSIGGHDHVTDAEIYYVLEGEIVVDDNGKEVVMTVKVGDKVITSKYSGTQVKLDGEELTIVRQNDILAIVE